MKNILSLAGMNRLVSFNISYEHITEIFKTRGLEETKSLLERKVNGFLNCFITGQQRASLYTTEKTMNLYTETIYFYSLVIALFY